MADIQYATQDVTIYDESGNAVSVVAEDGLRKLSVSDKDKTQVNFEEGRMFMVGTNALTFGTDTETPAFLFRNPTGSGKVVYINVYEMNVESTTLATIVRYYKNPTVTTNGTVVAYIRTNGASTVNSVAVGTVNPTVSANGTLIQTVVSAYGKSDEHSPEGTLSLIEGDSLLVTVADGKNKDLSMFVTYSEI